MIELSNALREKESGRVGLVIESKLNEHYCRERFRFCGVFDRRIHGSVQDYYIMFDDERNRYDDDGNPIRLPVFWDDEMLDESYIDKVVDLIIHSVVEERAVDDGEE